MELRFLEIDESHNALEIELCSAEEVQAYSKVFPVDIPEGSALVVRAGKSALRRPTLIVGIAKIGEPLRLKSDDDGSVIEVKPTPPQRAMPIQDVVKNASDKDLEVMAARNGVSVDDKWRGQSRALRNATVARALAKQNAV